MSDSIKGSSNADELAKDLLSDLEKFQKQLKFTIFRALTLLEAEILQNIRIKSGLKVRSGSLLNSIGASKKVVEMGNGLLIGEIGPQGIPYAAIHEFGGTTSPHRIEPRVAKVLAFKMNGQDVFARFVNHPGSKIPARPYLRPALAAKADQIKKEFSLLLYSSFSEKK